ncbi:alpha/beta hydrolase [Roseovarius sp. A21]|uniref:Alpha/beta hydrolase n=1 Tax=Roseovarius bejariae TaxID=2576383 RepID=A0A844D0F4_9RHOB|nr:alpha/beta hydrolase [Roseovarius bejariae]MRU16806.1 alpha/beta hydrolase [Roseovarius bejariae]
MDRAPFYSDVADGPEGGRAFWLRTTDGVRIRIGLWTPADAIKGTVLLFPGRTEYIEKYGRAAADFARRGYATLAVDWRGQGLSDRLLDDAMSGHVQLFDDYQNDVEAVVAALDALDLPRPLHLLGHSMGGCIGLRAAMNGLPVASCGFSGPMWGIHISTPMRPVAWSLSWGSRQMGLSHLYAPGTKSNTYVLAEPFESNKLTCDQDMYDYMITQAKAHPELTIGGPSLRWLHEALRETFDLSRQPSPDLPCLTLLGTEEDIVDIPRIRTRMAAWPDGRLEELEGGRHEVLMDTATMRKRAFDLLAAHYDTASNRLTGPASRKGAAAQGG